MRLGVCLEAQLDEDLPYVCLDGALGHEETRRKRFVREALGNQTQHLSLTFAQLGEWPARSRSSPGRPRLTYAYGALDRVTRGVYGTTLVGYVLAVFGFTALALALGALTLRRRTP
jgi:hypothetical protein